MTEFWNSVVTIVLAIIGIAGLAIIVSKQANTSAVLQAGGSSVGNLLGVALSPVTGNSGLSTLGNLNGLTPGASFL